MSEQRPGIDHPDLDQLLPHAPDRSAFALVIGAARRARDINDMVAGQLGTAGGTATLYASERPGHRAAQVGIALQEIAHGEIAIKSNPADEPEPPVS